MDTLIEANPQVPNVPPIDHAEQWRLSYLEELRVEQARRNHLLDRADRDPKLRGVLLRQYRDYKTIFIQDMCYVLEPRNADQGLPIELPFILWPRQRELIPWIDERRKNRENGFIEKSRGEGWSWILTMYCLHGWLFVPGFNAGIGSYKLAKVDSRGDPDTLFQKFRYNLYGLPDWLTPQEFREKDHDNISKIINPRTLFDESKRPLPSLITGEGGDEVGRGGRKSIYFIDEVRSLVNGPGIEAALSQNTNCILWGTTPGDDPGNFANQKHAAAREPQFRMSWRDNPTRNYTAERLNRVTGQMETYYPWREKQDEKFDPLTNSVELDLDWYASSESQLIPGKYIEAAMDLELKDGTIRASGLDVAGGGKDKTVYAHRRGGNVTRLEVIDLEPGEKERYVTLLCNQDATKTLYYDRLGEGSSVTATIAADTDNKFNVVGVANSEAASFTYYSDNDEVPASERFVRYGDELGWRLRLRFERSYERHRLGIRHPDEDCISLAPLKGSPHLQTLKAQLAQPRVKRMDTGKMKVDKKGGGTVSPDHYEAVMYAFADTVNYYPEVPPPIGWE